LVIKIITELLCQTVTFLSYFITFALQNQLLIMLETVSNTLHNEARQGEAYTPAPGLFNDFKKKFYIESYGCQMNFSDSEIVASILNEQGFGATRDVADADLILLNTCSIREKAEQTIRKRLTEFRSLKKARPGMLVGVLGCMHTGLYRDWLKKLQTAKRR
jgi:tRNA-2-methylthio-N6-dimethylallyladenosine synthase